MALLGWSQASLLTRYQHVIEPLRRGAAARIDHPGQEHSHPPREPSLPQGRARHRRQLNAVRNKNSYLGAQLTCYLGDLRVSQ